MGYKSLVDSQATMAFNILKDLADDVVLNKKDSVSFNFGTGVKEERTTPIEIKVVVLDDDKKSKIHNSIEREVLFKTRGLGDINAYDSMTFENAHDVHLNGTWKFGTILNNDGYTILARIYRRGVDSG